MIDLRYVRFFAAATASTISTGIHASMRRVRHSADVPDTSRQWSCHEPVPGRHGLRGGQGLVTSGGGLGVADRDVGKHR